MPANRSDMERARDQAWYGDPHRQATCPNCNMPVLDVARVWFNIGYDRGARWAIFYSTQLSPMFNKFCTLLTYLWPDGQTGR